LASELYDYFGFALTRQLFDGLVDEVRVVELDGDPPVALRQLPGSGS
jgi:hypothetical protein